MNVPPRKPTPRSTLPLRHVVRIHVVTLSGCSGSVGTLGLVTTPSLPLR